MPEYREITLNAITDGGFRGDGKQLGSILPWITAEICYINLAHPDSRELSKEIQDSSIAFINGLKVIPGTLGNVGVGNISFLDAPLYWSLSSAFKGDKVLSYNGHLTFTVKSDGGTPFPESVIQTYPLVQLQGNFRIILEYYPDMQAPDGRYRVQLNESLWKIKNNPESLVKRETMMIALQNIQQLLIRATDRPDFTVARLENVTLDVAIPAAPFSPVVAIGIEICICPPQYNGTSCQDPADGFYRKRKPGWLNSEDIDLVGFAHPCECNNRSQLCDKETGVCLNCQDNTDGHHCEKCAVGYYGDPSITRCLQCACPTIDNSFSDTCLLDEFGSVICTKCKEGYTGNRCQSCVHGYYGDPLLSGGSCKPCDCDLRGSLGNMCDAQTGACICLEGLKGRDCSVCTYRHILTDYGCQNCNDECTALLLNDLDSSISLIGSVNLTGISTAPWAQLRSINRTAAELRHRVNLYSDSVKHGEMLIVDFQKTFDLKGLSNALFLKAKEFSKNASTVSNSAAQTRNIAIDIQRETLSLQRIINVTVRHLMNYARAVDKVTVSVENAILEAEKKYNDINGSQALFIESFGNAEREKRKAQDLLEKVKKLIFKPKLLQDLENRLHKLETLLNDVLTSILPDVETILRDVHFKNENNRNRLKAFKNMWEQINNLTLEINARIEIGGAKLNEIIELIDSATQIILELQDLENTLRLVIWCCNDTACYEDITCLDKHVKFLVHLLPKYKQLYVHPAVEHADSLIRRVQMMASKLFNSTKNESEQAMKAVRAYQDIADIIDSAHKAAINASALANQTHSVVYPKLPEVSFVNQGNILLNESRTLKDTSKTRYNDSVTGLRNKLIGIYDGYQELNISNKNVEKKLKELNNNMDNMTSDVQKIAGELKRNISNISQMSVENTKTANKLIDMSKTILKPKLDKIIAASKEGVENLTHIVSKAEKDIQKLKTDTNKMEKRAEEMASMKANLDELLKNVMAQVLHFRQKASGVTVSLAGNCNCVHRLRHQVKSSATNTISLQFAITTDDANSLLFYMGSTKHLDFMAAEMVNRKIHFLWNAGKTTKVIEHPLQIESNTVTQYKNDRHWYAINIERIASRASLTVQCSSSQSMCSSSTVKGESDPLHEQIDFGDDALFYVGGIPPEVTRPKELVSRSYHGCLFNMKVDSENVGLWNFLGNRSCDRSCSGCKEGPKIEAAEPGSTFNGRGSYAEFIYKRPGRAVDTVLIRMKTFDENALLAFLYFPNKENRGFLSIHLEGGRVVLRVKPDYSGRNDILTITSNDKHNSGMLKSVEVKFTADGEGKLKIITTDEGNPSNDEKISYVPAEWVNKTLTLKDFKYYIGGVSPTFSQGSWGNISFSSFRGCIASLQLGTGVSDIIKATKFGVSAGCITQILNSFSTAGDGFLELIGQNLDNGTSFGFTFQAMKPTGILMISTFLNSSTTVNKHFYSLALLNGYLQLGVFGSGIHNISKPYLQINASHYVSVKRIGKEISVYVNDTYIYSINTSLNVIESPMDGGLFFSGVPDAIKSVIVSKKHGQSNTDSSFSGIIRDVVFNHKLIDFARKKSFKNVNIGATQEIVSPTPIKQHPLPTANSIPRCAKPSQINLAKSGVKLGDSDDSFITLNLQHQLNNKNFNISFDFRTFYPNGLLFAVRRGPMKRQHYFAMYLMDRHIELVFSDNKKKKLVLKEGVGFSDGKWHTIYVAKKSKTLSISHDKPGFGKSTKVPGKLNVENLFYMGGTPDGASSRRPIKLRLDPFRGCIKDFKINGLQKDLSPASQNVGQCFLNVEAGSQFGGDAYVIYANRFAVGLKMDVELEFRTTEMDGILLSVSERGNSPALALELYRGNVTLSVALGDGTVARQMFDFNGSSTYICNNQWHVVKAYYAQDILSLRVDKSEVKSVVIPTTSVSEIRTNSPLYIGGLPDDEPKGALLSVTNFKGCIRNVVIQSKRMDWTDMEKRVRVQLNSCEVQ